MRSGLRQRPSARYHPLTQPTPKRQSTSSLLEQLDELSYHLLVCHRRARRSRCPQWALPEARESPWVRLRGLEPVPSECHACSKSEITTRSCAPTTYKGVVLFNRTTVRTYHRTSITSDVHGAGARSVPAPLVSACHVVCPPRPRPARERLTLRPSHFARGRERPLSVPQGSKMRPFFAQQGL